MIVRCYANDDYNAVYDLVAKTMSRNLPIHLGGLGVVIEEEGQIVAFSWALVAPGCDIGCVEFFCVAPEKRDQKIYGPTVMTRLLIELQKFGVKEVVGLLVDGESHTESLARIYHDVGMTANHGYVVNGNIERILDGIKKRYLKG